MGVSILLTPGPVGRNFGKQVNITEGFRSTAANIIRDYFGTTPCTLVADQDLERLRTLQAGASVYTFDDTNIWKRIADELVAHSVVTIVLEY